MHAYSARASTKNIKGDTRSFILSTTKTRTKRNYLSRKLDRTTFHKQVQYEIRDIYALKLHAHGILN